MSMNSYYLTPQRFEELPYIEIAGSFIGQYGSVDKGLAKLLEWRTTGKMTKNNCDLIGKWLLIAQIMGWAK